MAPRKQTNWGGAPMVWQSSALKNIGKKDLLVGKETWEDAKMLEK